MNMRRMKFWDDALTHGVLIIISIIALFPVAYTLMTAFKTDRGVITSPPTFFPQEWSFEGFQSVLFESDMLRYYLPNTILNSTVSSLLVVVLAALAAYTFSRYHFRGSRTLELVILGVMMIPALSFVIPYYRMATDLNMLNTNGFIIATYVAWGIPFSIWIVRSFIDAIPIELEEAALIDGATPLKALRYVVIPLAMPGMIAAFLLVFVDTWNEFLMSLVLLSGNARTATVGLYDFQGQYEIAYNVWTAACIVIMVPVLVIFLALRRHFFDAMLQGAVKS